MEKPQELFRKLGELPMEPAVKRMLDVVIHRLRYPMADILAHKSLPPGNTGKAARLKVSRQTIYVWLSEKYRPTMVQAKRIAKVTGIPVENIVDNGFEVKREARSKARKKAARVAKSGRKVKGRDRDAPPERQGTGEVGDHADAA